MQYPVRRMLPTTAHRGPGRTVAVWYNQMVAIWLSTKDAYVRTLEYLLDTMALSSLRALSWRNGR